MQRMPLRHHVLGAGNAALAHGTPTAALDAFTHAWGMTDGPVD